MASGESYSIVVGVDFSETGELALRQALTMARDRAPAGLHVVHVATDEDLDNAEGSSMLERKNAVLETLPARMWDQIDATARDMSTPPGQTSVYCHVRFGKPADALKQVAIDYEADLLMVGTHGRRGLERMVLGSVAETLIRVAPCPVMAVRPRSYDGARKSDRVEPPPRPGEQRTSSWPPSEPHIYVSSQLMNWSEHNSDTSGPTGIRMF